MTFHLYLMRKKMLLFATKPVMPDMMALDQYAGVNVLQEQNSVEECVSILEAVLII